MARDRVGAVEAPEVVEQATVTPEVEKGWCTDSQRARVEPHQKRKKTEQ